MDPCKEQEPRVINDSLLKQMLDEQLPGGEAGKLAREEGVNYEEVTHIRLEFLYILKIDHLWVLPALTKLSLNNNFIEKIENLDSLVNLTELDLSFNKISKLENLDKLVNLIKISFYDNFIETLENMDAQTKLRIFSIGKNRIKDRDNVLYLRRFDELTSLNMAGNPCAEQEHFRIYIAVFLPKLIYYEYRKLQPSEKNLGTEHFSSSLKLLESKDAQEQAVREAKEKEERDAELHSSSFVEYLNTQHLFNEMYAKDEEGLLFLEMDDEVQEFYDEYKENFLALCMQVFEIGQKHYIIRKKEIEEFFEITLKAKLDDQKESIAEVDNFLQKKKDIFNDLRHLYKKTDYTDDINYDESYTTETFYEKVNDSCEEYSSLIHTTWKMLMKSELYLSEQLEEVIQTFDHTVSELLNNFLEECQGVFTIIRSLEVQYSENISDIGNRLLANTNLNEEKKLPDKMDLILADKEVLINAIGATHDLHMVAIDNREDLLTNRARTWFKDLISGLLKEETERNRNKVLEINHFLDIQREEFDDLLKEFFRPPSESDSDLMQFE